jgi:hypothetical protein
LLKKQREKLGTEKIHFIAGAIKQGFGEQIASHIFELLISFASRGLRKSYAAAYAILTYQTAYLKAHFPAEFMTAYLSHGIDRYDEDYYGSRVSPKHLRFREKLKHHFVFGVHFNGFKWRGIFLYFDIHSLETQV